MASFSSMYRMLLTMFVVLWLLFVVLGMCEWGAQLER